MSNYRRKNHQTKYSFETNINNDIQIAIVDTSARSLLENGIQNPSQRFYTGDVENAQYADLQTIRRMREFAIQTAEQSENTLKEINEREKFVKQRNDKLKQKAQKTDTPVGSADETNV